MSILKKEFDGEGFTGVIYTLQCDSSGLKMLDIMARGGDEENALTTNIEVNWFVDQVGIGSGKHSLSGLLSYGPVDNGSEKTTILDIIADEKDGEMDIKIVVRPEDGPPPEDKEDNDE